MNNLLLKALSGIGAVALIFLLGFISGYHIKSNSVNSATAKQDIKLASLQARYDEVSALTAGDYLTAFNGVLHQYESNPTINTNDNHHDKLWNFFHSKHNAGQVAKNQPTCITDEITTTRLKTDTLNTIQLEFLQSYIKQIQELQ